MTVNSHTAKKQLRQQIRQARVAIDQASMTEATESLTKQLSNLVIALGAKAITCYMPINGEPDTRPFLTWAVEQGVQVLLPRSREDGKLEWAELRDSHQDDKVLQPGLFGILEPTGMPVTSHQLKEVDLMLVPAAAVDTSGSRLGWGRGYFDKVLAATPPKIPVYAVVHDDEILMQVPTETHDRPVTGAVTPSKTWSF